METQRPSRYGNRVTAAIAQEVNSNIMSIDDVLKNGHHNSNTTIENSGKSSKSMIGKKELKTVSKNCSSFTSSNDCDNSKLKMSLNSSQVVDSNLIFSGPMYEAYQTWALKTYGDSAKTKTVTQKKYNRIVKILKGEESSCVENSKFRFWVKAKGFKLGYSHLGKYSQAEDKEEQVLLVPCNKTPGNTSVNNSGQCKNEDVIYKRVAVVENFYQIIYVVHVEMDGRSGKHAGQKRTYRAVAEMYAFLPREAVTRFLMSCSDCQKRMHLQGLSANETENSISNMINANSKKSASSSKRNSLQSQNSKEKMNMHTKEEVDYNLPITTTYLKRMKSLGYNNYSNDQYTSDANRIDLHSNLIIAGSVKDQDLDEIGIISETVSDQASDSIHDNHTLDLKEVADEQYRNGNKRLSGHKIDVETDAEPQSLAGDDVELIDSSIPLDMSKMRSSFEINEQVGNLSNKSVSKGVKRKLDSSPKFSKSNSTFLETSKSVTGESESNHDPNVFIKEEDEEEEDEEENDNQSNDRSEPANHDPERLKAFNMFVRLFVDENLDRMVPISKQPKDKIHAIIDSCTRQFPEFAERARKRIRTYLKSCRRTRRNKAAIASSLNGKDSTGHEFETKTSTSSYHLASAMAEQILANACKNEYKNAKRMRIGLKPLAVNINEVNESLNAILSCSVSPSSEVEAQVIRSNTTSSNSNLLTMLTNQAKVNGETVMRKEPYKLNDISGPISALKTQVSSARENRSNRLSSVNLGNNQLHHGYKYSLNPDEMAAVKQLIYGYRESAAFLLRSAIELEHLLLQQT